jgi:hypothetical protein
LETFSSKEEVKMKKNYFLLSIGVLFLGFGLNAQESEIEAEEEDFSQYADLEMMDGGKRFTTSKVLDLSPTNLYRLAMIFRGHTN